MTQLKTQKSKKEKIETLFQEQHQELLQQGKRFGLPVCFDLKEYPFVKESVQLLDYGFVKAHSILPLEQRGKQLLIALSDPLDLKGVEEARALLKKPLVQILAPKELIDAAIGSCYHQRKEVAANFIASLADKQEIGTSPLEEYDLLGQKESSPIIQLLNVMLTEAIQQGASDIHFEPDENGIGVRYRIDGVLQLRHSPPKEYQTQLITRIKVMARLDIAQQRMPQDGRMKLNLGGRQIDFRVSSIPIAFGERIVLRILDKTTVLLGLDQLGIPEELLDELRRLIRMSEGIILVTGPTGSGKTTTLYSALSELQSPEINIMTIEDPVEFKLQGMAQINVNPKIQLTFAKGLRHILRQDPDVIMIGEIRDKETAEIAIQSALTGHLVLSTLHTNDAPSALTRLIDMGVEPFLLSSTILAVVAQRLVRKICPSCKCAYEPSDFELLELGMSRKQLKKGALFKGAGCEECYFSGYKGRHGIYELMVMKNSIKQQLVKSGDATLLQKTALESGMETLRQSGALLVKNGITTASELLRVSRSCEEI